MRWPLTEQDKKTIVAKLMAIIDSDDWPCCLRACRILIELESQNQADENSDAGQLRNRIEKILANLQSDEPNN